MQIGNGLFSITILFLEIPVRKRKMFYSLFLVLSPKIVLATQVDDHKLKMNRLIFKNMLSGNNHNSLQYTTFKEYLIRIFLTHTPNSNRGTRITSKLLIIFNLTK